MPRQPDLMSIDFPHLVSPYEIAEFLDRYWEKRPLVISRNDPDYYQDLFTTSKIDQMLVQSRPVYPQVRVLSKGTGVAWDALSEGWLQHDRNGDGNLAAVHEAYAQGNS